jgi:hypothetical protein
MRNSGVFDGLLIECPRCGQYELIGHKTIGQSFAWTAEIRNALSCAARQASEGGQPLQIEGATAADLAQPHLNTRVSDNQERLLREIARRAGRPQKGAGFSLATDFTLIDCYSEEEFIWYIEWLERQQLVFRTGSGPKAVELTLSMEGWKRVQPLPRSGGVPGRCFVAMWFSEETRAAYERGIEPAVSD